MSEYSLNPRVLGELHTGLGQALDGVKPITLGSFSSISNNLDELASGISYESKEAPTPI